MAGRPLIAWVMIGVGGLLQLPMLAFIPLHQLYSAGTGWPIVIGATIGLLLLGAGIWRLRAARSSGS